MEEPEQVVGMTEQKKRLLHWSIFVGLMILAVVLGDSAMPYLPAVIQASLVVCLCVIAFLYLYSIVIETELELHLGLLCIITIAYGLFALARLAVRNFSPAIIGASALAIIILLLGYVFYPKIRPMVGIAIREPKEMKRAFLPQFTVKQK